MGDFAYIGSRSIGGAIPIAATAQAQLDASLGVLLAEMQAELAGAIEAHAQLVITPPSLGAGFAAAMDLVTNLQALIDLGLPSASIDLSAALAVIAELRVQLGALEAAASFAAELSGILGSAGVYVWTYSGAPGGIVPGWSGPGGDVWAVILAAGAGATQVALKTTFGVST
jgi:hypothetical protein